MLGDRQAQERGEHPWARKKGVARERTGSAGEQQHKGGYHVKCGGGGGAGSAY